MIKYQFQITYNNYKQDSILELPETVTMIEVISDAPIGKLPSKGYISIKNLIENSILKIID